MGSSNLGRFIVAVIVMLILMGLTAKHVLNDNNNATWQNLSAQGLNTKIQTGLTQMYWQWQQEGRAKQIEYRPENVKQTFIINMTNKGLPKIEMNADGCIEFLSWFVDENVLSNQLEVTTTFIERNVTKRVLANGNKENAKPVYICQFLYANEIFKYDLATGQFTFTD